MTAVLPEVWRWTCPNCGRWIKREAIHAEDRIDPGAYYGVSTVVTGECTRCGLVTDPQLRPVVWQDGGQS